MEFNNAYIIAAIVFALLVVVFVLSKIVGCGIKLLKFAIIAVIIGLVVYGAKTLIGG